MLSVDNLVLHGLGKNVVLTCKKNIYVGDALPEFGVKAMMYSGPVFGDLTNDSLLIETVDAEHANGVFVRDHVDAITLGAARQNGGFIASDQFGGCDLTMLKNPHNEILGAHVYVDVGKHEFRDKLTSPPSGWTVIGTWQSSVHLQKWLPPPSLLALAFIEPSRIRVVAIGVSGYPGKICNVSVAKTFQLT